MSAVILMCAENMYLGLNIFSLDCREYNTVREKLYTFTNVFPPPKNTWGRKRTSTVIVVITGENRD